MTTTSPAVFLKAVRSINGLPDATAKRAVKLNAATAVLNAQNSVKAATGGTARLRNAGANVKAGGRVVGKRGATLTVASKLEREGSQALIRAVGPWQLIENNTASHDIAPAGQAKDVLQGPTLSGKTLKSKSGRAGVKSRTGRARALRTPYGLKRRVHVKGTKGKQPWAKALAKTKAEAPLALKAASKLELAKVLR